MAHSLASFFNPSSIAVVGASQNPAKLGAIIFQNILDAGFMQPGDSSSHCAEQPHVSENNTLRKLYPINPKLGNQSIAGHAAYASITDVKTAIDLVVIVVPGKFVSGVIDDCVKNRTKNVIIISAGFGEVGNHELEDEVKEKCAAAGIRLLGPNCLGAIFPYAKVNASFADGMPKPGPIGFISQSGAFCTAMLDWATEKNIGFSHFVSLGNKADISEMDLVAAMAEDPNVEVIALYLETIAFGAPWMNLIRNVAKQKPVVILEPGESTAAQAASLSHTGSLAPNARIIREAYRHAGAIQVSSMRDMFGVIQMLTWAPGRNMGRNVAVLTNAGGVGVLTSDLIEKYGLKLPRIDAQTTAQLQAVLPATAGLGNPIDVIGDADAQRYQDALDVLVQAPGIDQILVLLTPQKTTQVLQTAQIIAAARQKTQKNIVASFVGGQKVRPGAQLLQSKAVPVYDFPDDAVRVMGLISNRLGALESTDQIALPSPEPELVKTIKTAKANGLSSLPQPDVRDLMASVGVQMPVSCESTNKAFTLAWAADFWAQNPNEVLVMKISAPEAIHKTELKGVILGITDEEELENAWEMLRRSIAKGTIKNATIQTQHQIQGGQSLILGVTTDKNFGRVMVVGAGGIYSEIVADTAVRVLPTNRFDQMLEETNIGEIISGARGEDPLAVQALHHTMQAVQNLMLTYPQITAIDINPLILTKTASHCVDVKIILK
jgi:acyl-CoA synthetase (NDP forming)